MEQLVEELAERLVQVLLGLAQALGEIAGPLEDADLAVEAVEELDVSRLVGDLGGEEDALLLLRAGAHDGPELVGDPLLADEESREPVHALVALLRRNALVPVDPVLAEVEVLGRPLLALPQQVELLVGEELGLAAVGRFLERRVGGLLEALLLGDLAERPRRPGLGGLRLRPRFHGHAPYTVFGQLASSGWCLVPVLAQLVVEEA